VQRACSFRNLKNIENKDSSGNKKSCGIFIKLYNSFGCLQTISLHEDKKESPVFICLHALAPVTQFVCLIVCVSVIVIFLSPLLSMVD
jgi:hypothetical protein